MEVVPGTEGQPYAYISRDTGWGTVKNTGTRVPGYAEPRMHMHLKSWSKIIIIEMFVNAI